MRQDKINYYLDVADSIANRGTCLRRNYGAVIVNNDEIVSTGYNGAPRGTANCCDTGKCYRKEHNIPHGTQYEKCITGNSVIKLLDGTYKTIEQLTEEKVTEFWTYSIDTETGQIVPAKAVNPHCTGIRDDILEITFDDGTKIQCTSDHKILMRDCTYKQANELQKYDSVMPMYYNFQSASSRNGEGHEAVCNTISMRKGRLSKEDKCKTGQTPTHHLVHFYFNPKDKEKFNNDFVVHHKDENKLNNEPDNLEMISRVNHTKHHTKRGKESPLYKAGAKQREILAWKSKHDEEFRKKNSENGKKSMTKNWNNPEFREKMLKLNSENGKKTIKYLNNSPEMRQRMIQGKILNGLSLLICKMKENHDNVPIDERNYNYLQKKYRIAGRGGVQIPMLKTVKKYFGELSVAVEKAKTYNHKVVDIKRLNVSVKVYDLTVPKYHNFPIDLGNNSCVFVHNCKSCHAEQNAIISASRKDMIGADLYLVGFDVETNDYVKNANCCTLCKRMIINAGIKRVYVRIESPEYKVYQVEDWIRDDKYMDIN